MESAQTTAKERLKWASTPTAIAPNAVIVDVRAFFIVRIDLDLHVHRAMSDSSPACPRYLSAR